MSQMLRSQGETLDEATGLVQSHIKKNEPVWKLDYFDDKKPEQDWLNNNINQNLNNVDYGYDPATNYNLEWDGKNLRWMKNGKEAKSWGGMSGAPEYQCKAYQGRPNEGPLPEGKYSVKQKDYQRFDDLPLWERTANQVSVIPKLFNVSKGSWPGGTAAWGRHRIWLDPNEETNTRGRNNFSIHGGWTSGSAGCIDLTDGMNDFAQDYRNHGRDLELNVKYPKDCW